MKTEKWSHDEQSITIFAFRYCLGRDTAAPSICARWLVNNWDKIDRTFQKQIQDDINRAIACDMAGKPYSVNEWNEVLKLKPEPPEEIYYK